jgi:hypothetical protein
MKIIKISHQMLAPEREIQAPQHSGGQDKQRLVSTIGHWIDYYNKMQPHTADKAEFDKYIKNAVAKFVNIRNLLLSDRILPQDAENQIYKVRNSIDNMLNKLGVIADLDYWIGYYEKVVKDPKTQTELYEIKELLLEGEISHIEAMQYLSQIERVIKDSVEDNQDDYEEILPEKTREFSEYKKDDNFRNEALAIGEKIGDQVDESYETEDLSEIIKELNALLQKEAIQNYVDPALLVFGNNYESLMKLNKSAVLYPFIVHLKGKVPYETNQLQFQKVEQHVKEGNDESLYNPAWGRDIFHGIALDSREDAANYFERKFEYILNNYDIRFAAEYLRKAMLYSLETSDVAFNYMQEMPQRYFEMFKDVKPGSGNAFLDESFLLRSIGSGNINQEMINYVLRKSINGNGSFTKISFTVPAMMRLIDYKSLEPSLAPLVKLAEKKGDEDFLTAYKSGLLLSNLDDAKKDKYALELSGNQECLSQDSIESMTPEQKMTLVKGLGIIFKGYHGTSQSNFNKIKESGGMKAGKLLDKPAVVSRPGDLKQYSDQIYISCNRKIAQGYQHQKNRVRKKTGPGTLLHLRVPIYHLYESKLLMGVLDINDYLLVQRYKGEMNINMLTKMASDGSLKTVKDLSKALLFLNSFIETTLLAFLDHNYIVAFEESPKKKVKDKPRDDSKIRRRSNLVNWYRIKTAQMEFEMNSNEKVENMIDEAIKDYKENSLIAYFIKMGYDHGVINEENENEFYDLKYQIEDAASRVMGIDREDPESEHNVHLFNSILNLLDRLDSIPNLYDVLATKPLEEIESEGFAFLDESSFFNETGYEEMLKEMEHLSPEEISEMMDGILSKGGSHEDSNI